MTRHARRISPFASDTLARHLARGSLAAALIALAVAVNGEFPLLAACAGIAAVVMLRGCPMCWTIGLCETLMQRRRHATSDRT
jgi:hypothetical protein